MTDYFDLDEFLQEATLTLHDVWTEVGGRELTAKELQELSTLLTSFFTNKAPEKA